MYNRMIFFSVWLYVCSREVLRESFDFPETSTIIGILGILGILVSGWPSIVGLLGLTSSDPQSQCNEPSPETPTIPSLPSLPPVAGLLALTSSLPPVQHTEPKPKTPATPHQAPPQPLTCSSLRLTAARGWGYAPTHKPTDELIIIPVQLQYNSI